MDYFFVVIFLTDCLSVCQTLAVMVSLCCVMVSLCCVFILFILDISIAIRTEVLVYLVVTEWFVSL